jgi:hypothetical protein
MTDAVVQDQTPAEAPAPAPGETTEAPKTNGVGSIMESEAEGAPAASTWPEDWRERWAGKDEKFLGTLKRYASPENVAKAYGALRQQLHNGELIKRLPEGASEEQVKAWRDEMGLPPDPTGYKLPTVSGHEWTDADKPMVEAFLAEAHGANFNQAQVDKALGWYAAQQQAVLENQFQTDTQARQQLEDDLRMEWGPEFRSNIGLMRRYLEADIPDGGAAIVSARLEDGSRLIDQPWFAKWITELARDRHGDAAFVSGDGSAAVEGEIEKLEALMHNNPDEYYRTGSDKKLLAAYERKMKRRG